MSGAQRSSRRTAVLAALGAAAVDVVAVTVFWRAHELRRAVLSVLDGGGDGHSLRDFDPVEVKARGLALGRGYMGLADHAFAAFAGEAQTLAIGGAVLAVLALAAMLVGVSRARRRGALAALAVASPAAILGVAGAAMLRSSRAFLLDYFSGGSSAVGEAAERYTYDAVAGYADPHQAARLVILAVAILSTLGVLALIRGAPTATAPQPRPLRLVMSAGLFAAGLAAFALTRAQAADLRSPMPFASTRDHLWLSNAQAAALPPAYRCEHLINSPFVVLEPRGLVADGVAVPDQAEMVRVLTAKREQWRQVQPNKPFPGVVAVAFPADTKLAVARPLIAALRSAGYPNVHVLEGRPTTSWSSQTLGEVTNFPRGCAVRIEAGRDLPPADTWGEMVRALVSGD